MCIHVHAEGPAEGHVGFLSPSLGSGRLPPSMPPHSTPHASYLSIMPSANASVGVVPLCDVRPVSAGVQRVPEKAAENEASCLGHPSKTVPDAMLQVEYSVHDTQMHVSKAVL